MPVNLPESTTTSPLPTESTSGKQVRNFLIALVAIALSIALFWGLRTETPLVLLDAQAEASMPLEVAVSNGKPTFVEFYANWCTSCQAMAKDLGELKQEYAQQVNFVMLNVDNTKWLPEILRYRVDGIPHFVFLGKDGEAIAQSIGEIPRPLMAANLEALIASLPLPYTQANGQISNFAPPVAPAKTTTDNPLSHSSQAKS